MIWEISENGIKPKRQLKCPICGDKLILHDFSVNYNSFNKIYHADVHMKCVNCSFFATFGIPLSKEQFEMLRKSKLSGRILKEEVMNEDERIAERLKKLGYW